MIRSHESRLLIAASRAETGPASLAFPLDGVDWTRLIDRAVRLGLAGQVRLFVQPHPDHGLVPPPALARLDAVYYEQAAHTAFLYTVLGDLLAAFRGEALPVVVLKGAALSGPVYRNLALRPMRDLDLLVRPDDLAAAETLMYELGYVADESFRPRSWYLDRHHHLPPFLPREGPAVVELHWQLTPSRVPVTVPMRELWERAVAVDLAGTRALVLAADDLVVHLALHLAGTDGFVGKLGALCDISAIIRREGSALRWDRLVDTACRSGAAGYVYYALWLAGDVVGAGIPRAVVRALEEAVGNGRVVDRAIKWFGSWAVLASGDPGGSIPPGVFRKCGRALLIRHPWWGGVGGGSNLVRVPG